MNTLSSLLGVGLMALALTASAQTTVYTEDFEDDTSGATVPVIGGTNIGGYYAAVEGAVVIATNPEASGNTSAQVLALASDTTASGNQIAALFARRSVSMVYISNTISIAAFPPPVATMTVCECSSLAMKIANATP